MESFNAQIRWFVYLDVADPESFPLCEFLEEVEVEGADGLASIFFELSDVDFDLYISGTPDIAEVWDLFLEFNIGGLLAEVAIDIPEDHDSHAVGSGTLVKHVHAENYQALLIKIEQTVNNFGTKS